MPGMPLCVIKPALLGGRRFSRGRAHPTTAASRCQLCAARLPCADQAAKLTASGGPRWFGSRLSVAWRSAMLTVLLTGLRHLNRLRSLLWELRNRVRVGAS